MFTIMAMTLPFLCRQKQKPRFDRGFGGIFELFSIVLATRSDSAPPPQTETDSGQTGGTC
jgi:hypothetical protein